MPQAHNVEVTEIQRRSSFFFFLKKSTRTAISSVVFFLLVISREATPSSRKVEHQSVGGEKHECAMSPSSSSSQNRIRTARMSTQQHLSNQANQADVCFVLNDYVDDPDTSAYMVGQNVPLPTESAKQTPLTPTASAAVENKNGGTFEVHAVDDNDEPWLSDTDFRTGWNKEFKSGTYRGMLYRTVLRDYPQQVVSLATAESVPANTREFLHWTQRHYRIDVTSSFHCRTQNR